jgi:hypothetical protein
LRATADKTDPGSIQIGSPRESLLARQVAGTPSTASMRQSMRSRKPAGVVLSSQLAFRAQRWADAALWAYGLRFWQKSSKIKGSSRRIA